MVHGYKIMMMMMMMMMIKDIYDGRIILSSGITSCLMVAYLAMIAGNNT